MYRLKFSVKTLSPIVITSTSNSTVMTGTDSAFGGSIIRGVLASRFVKVQKLDDEVHDKDFREIFYGDVKFLPANPEILSERSFVFPLSLQRGKAGTPDGDAVKDLLAEEKAPAGYKSFRDTGVLVKEIFYTDEVKTNISMHMSRSGEHERLAGKSVDGQIYNYESIDAEQTFQGEILGDEKTLRKLLDGLKLDGGKMSAYVGRSKFTQYGKCLITFGKVEEFPAQIFGEKIFLRLDTPLIPQDDYFIDAKKVLQVEVVDKLGKNFSPGKVFASHVEIENFVVPWSMKRPRVMALAAGTVFELKTSGLTADDKKILAEKILDGFGTRTEEGFGQCRLWTPSKNRTVIELDDEKNRKLKVHKPEKFSDTTIKLAKKILMTRLLEQVRLFAYEDAQALENQIGLYKNMTHFFTRLDKILANVDKKNLREAFKKQLKAELRDGSQFKEHLKKLCMSNGRKFYDVLVEGASLPIDGDRLSSTLKNFSIAELKIRPEDFPQDEIHFEYLTNYFRFARKISAGLKGGAIIN